MPSEAEAFATVAARLGLEPPADRSARIEAEHRMLCRKVETVRAWHAAHSAMAAVAPAPKPT